MMIIRYPCKWNILRESGKIKMFVFKLSDCVLVVDVFESDWCPKYNLILLTYDRSSTRVFYQYEYKKHSIEWISPCDQLEKETFYMYIQRAEYI